MKQASFSTHAPTLPFFLSRKVEASPDKAKEIDVFTYTTRNPMSWHRELIYHVLSITNVLMRTPKTLFNSMFIFNLGRIVFL